MFARNNLILFFLSRPYLLNHIFLSLGKKPADYLYEKLSRSTGHRIISGGKVFIGWDQNNIENGKYFYAFSHIPHHKLKLPDNTFTITCVREPVDRLLSHYKMLLHFKKNNTSKYQHTLC